MTDTLTRHENPQCLARIMREAWSIKRITKCAFGDALRAAWSALALIPHAQFRINSMIITGGTTVRSETVAGIRVSLCKDHESGMFRIQVTLDDDRRTSGLIDSIVADEIASEDYDGFLDQAAEAMDVVSLGDLFE